MAVMVNQNNTIKEGVHVSIKNKHFLRYPDHANKIFKVISVDADNYCELEWIKADAKDRAAFIPKDHLTISR